MPRRKGTDLTHRCPLCRALYPASDHAFDGWRMHEGRLVCWRCAPPCLACQSSAGAHNACEACAEARFEALLKLCRMGHVVDPFPRHTPRDYLERACAEQRERRWNERTRRGTSRKARMIFVRSGRPKAVDRLRFDLLEEGGLAHDHLFRASPFTWHRCGGGWRRSPIASAQG